MAASDTMSSAVIEVSDRDFRQTVIEQSRRVPVVVDFWAPWCGPCRMIGPVLERLAAEANGAWILAKLNVDHNPQTASRYGIQGIPAVKGFRNGQVVSEFVGAVPEPQIRRFVDQLVPSAADTMAAEAKRLEAAGNLAQAETAYRHALRSDATHPAALLGLGRVLFQRDLFDEALATLQRVPLGKLERQEAEGWIAKASFRQEAALSGGEVEARRRLAANPNDLDARLALAAAMAAKGSYREALEGYLEVVRRDRGAFRQQARQAMLSLFTLLGDEHELTKEYRPQLAMLLF
jgi:putative thioredoxin